MLLVHDDCVAREAESECRAVGRLVEADLRGVAVVAGPGAARGGLLLDSLNGDAAPGSRQPEDRPAPPLAVADRHALLPAAAADDERRAGAGLEPDGFEAVVVRREVRTSCPTPRPATRELGRPTGSGSDRAARRCFRRSFARASVGRAAGPIAGSSLSQTRFSTACMSRVPLVIATTASCSGITSSTGRTRRRRDRRRGGSARTGSRSPGPSRSSGCCRSRSAARWPSPTHAAREQLLAVPLALLQVELAELGDVLGAHVQAVAAERDALRARVPRSGARCRAARTGAAAR